MKITKEDILATKNAYQWYQDDGLLDRYEAVDTCNQVLNLCILLLTETKSLNKKTTSIRNAFEQLLPAIYIGKPHVLVAAHYLGFKVGPGARGQTTSLFLMNANLDAKALQSYLIKNKNTVNMKYIKENKLITKATLQSLNQ
jgi:hypothetical protein